MDFSRKQKIFIGLFMGSVLLFVTLSFYFYQIFFAKNVLVNKQDKILIIPPDTDYEKLVPYLQKEEYISDLMSFRFVSKVLKYNQKIKAGRYLVKANDNNLNFVRMLRAGNQYPVKVTFNNVRLKRDLAGKITRNLLLDSAEFLQKINQPDFVANYGFDTTSIVSMFLPNTYQMYWTTSVEELFEKMSKEHQKFWNKKRLDKAQEIGLEPLKISVLASIVEAETKKKDEAARVAGVYINRLRTGELLRADPTVIFAIGDFSIKRLLFKHLEFDSPYNTYKYAGLPPGLICLPSIHSLDAVLNYEKHDFIFFCAKEDFSGYHNFAVSYNEHLQNAKRYQAALDILNIKK